MITRQLISPASIAVIGGSNDMSKPGGSVLKNLLENKFEGEIYVVNNQDESVLGLNTYKEVTDLPDVDCAILALPARDVPDAVNILTARKGCKAVIVFSAGFTEYGAAGKAMEKEIVDLADRNAAALIGPNCIGIATDKYSGIFTMPNNISEDGVTIVSASGATVVFIMEEAERHALNFSNIFSVGNSAQIGVEDVLEYLDMTFTGTAAHKVITLYIENIANAQAFATHTRSLIRKGASIVAIKSGYTSAGSKAAMSHTGALSTPDSVVDALFKKCGIIRAYGREELVNIAAILKIGVPAGKKTAIVTHAGGPAIMLADTLSASGIEIPDISGERADRLLSSLFTGSTVSNPIDFLSTGTPEQLEAILDACITDFDVDSIIVIYGSPGLKDVYPAYEILLKKIKESSKPIYPILPSVVNAASAIDKFHEKGGISFSDEVVFGKAFAKVLNRPSVAGEDSLPAVDVEMIRKVIEKSENGMLSQRHAQMLLDAAGIERAKEFITSNLPEALDAVRSIGFPVVMKVVGPVHKSDIGGVVLNITDEGTFIVEFNRMIKLPGVTDILIQPMLSGTEVFVGAKREERFGTVVMCGLGGIFVETIRDIALALAPVSRCEAEEMIKGLKCYDVIRGTRGRECVNEVIFADIIRRVSALCTVAPEICELDLNPLLGNSRSVTAIDIRIRIIKD